MTPGYPIANKIFEQLGDATTFSFAIVRETPTDDLRNALAALSVFKGPGTVARDFAIQIIRHELAEREGA